MRALRKIALQLLDDRQHRFVVRIDAEDNFVLRIIQAAETGEIFVRVRIEAAERLQDADRRSEARVRRARRLAEISPGAVDRDQVINERDRRNPQENVSDRHVIRLLDATRIDCVSSSLPPLSATTFSRSRPTSFFRRGTADCAHHQIAALRLQPQFLPLLHRR